jgi:hypothetical protein
MFNSSMSRQLRRCISELTEKYGTVWSAIEMIDVKLHSKSLDPIDYRDYLISESHA